MYWHQKCIFKRMECSEPMCNVRNVRNVGNVGKVEKNYTTLFKMIFSMHIAINSQNYCLCKQITIKQTQ